MSPLRRSLTTGLTACALSAIPLCGQTAGSAADSADAPAADSTAVRYTTDGVYTEEQAARGEDVMLNVCIECHVDDDYTGAFIADWSGASVWGLWDSIWSTMPEDNPGGLPDRDYSDVIAYIFRVNGLPPGDVELPVDRDLLEKILIRVDP